MQAATLAAAIQQTQEVGHRLPSIRTSVASPPAQHSDISLGQKIFNRFRNQEAVLSECWAESTPRSPAACGEGVAGVIWDHDAPLSDR